MAGVFEAIEYVSGPATLIAFALAIWLHARMRDATSKDKLVEKALEKANADDVPQLVKMFLERDDVDLRELPRDQRLKYLAEVKNKTDSKRHNVRVMIIVAYVAGALLGVTFIFSLLPENSTPDYSPVDPCDPPPPPEERTIQWLFECPGG